MSKAQTAKLKVFFLPPYSLHLNPDEHVWAHVKHDVVKGGVEDKGRLKRLALSALRQL
jgi:transposase